MNRRGGVRPSRTRLWVTMIVILLLLVSAGIYYWFNMVTIQLLLLRQTNWFLDENILNWESMGEKNQSTKPKNNAATAAAGDDQKETNHAEAHITRLNHDNNNDDNDTLLLTVVFYNLYNPANATMEDSSNITAIEQAVRNIMEEQLLVSNRNHAIRKIFIQSIGHRKLQPLINGTILLQHDENGTELETLVYLWDYCKSHPHEKVVYLHSKGSFHPSENNDALRRFLTRGALSKECERNLPDWCNVCSSRMLPLPHVHTPGNMWKSVSIVQSTQIILVDKS